MARNPDIAHGPADAGRRSVLLSAAALALTVSGCSGTATRTTADGTRGPQLSAPTAPASGGAAPSAAALPHPTPWRPNAADVDPQVKLRAVQLIEALGTWRPGGGGAAKARARVTALGLPGALADQAGPLLSGADEAALQVIDAQYGGILTDSASVLVVCRQWTRSGGGPVTAERYDGGRTAEPGAATLVGHGAPPRHPGTGLVRTVRHGPEGPRRPPHQPAAGSPRPTSAAAPSIPPRWQHCSGWRAATASM